MCWDHPHIPDIEKCVGLIPALAYSEYGYSFMLYGCVGLTPASM